MPGDHDPATRSSQRHGLGEGRRGHGGDVDDDVGPPARGLAEGGDRVVAAHVDGEVGAEALGPRQPVGVTIAGAGHHHERGTGVLGRGGDAQAPDARAEDGDDVAGLGARHPHAPADAGARAG